MAEVSSSKKCYTIGLKEKNAYRSCSSKLTSFQLCSVNSSSSCITPFQLWPPLLSSDYRGSSQFFSQLFSTALKFFVSSHLSSTLFTFSHLFSTLLNDSHLCPPLLTSSQPFCFYREACTRTSFYTEQAFTQRSFYAEKLSHLQSTIKLRAAATELQPQNRILTPKRKKTICEYFVKGILKGGHQRQNGDNSAAKALELATLPQQFQRTRSFNSHKLP